MADSLYLSSTDIIKQIFTGFSVDGVAVPVVHSYYFGHGETYITYEQVDTAGSFAGDDELLGFVEYYDFDVYSRDGDTAVISAMANLLGQYMFMFQPSRSSGDMYEPDTGYHHRVLNFAYLREA